MIYFTALENKEYKMTFVITIRDGIFQGRGSHTFWDEETL